MSDDDNLFGSDGDDTDDLIAVSKDKGKDKGKAKPQRPPAKKRLQKKAAPAPRQTKNIPDADNDSDDDGPGLFDDSDDEEGDQKPKAKPGKSSNTNNNDDDNKPMSKRERMEALQARKRQEQGSGDAPSKKKTPRSDKEGEDKGYQSDDSYDSATYVRTKEDNDFIDVDDDDPDAINELYAEQHFDDERPDDESDEEGAGRKRKKASSSQASRRKRGPDAVSDDEGQGDGEPVNPIMAAVHKMKKKKRVAKKLSELEDEAKEFLSQMERAANDDDLAIRERRPAAKKLALLPQVSDMLTRRDMTRLLLDFELLSICKRWIQPLPNGSLGNVTVRQRLLQVISGMTGEQGITAHDLKRSEFGKVVMTLYMHKSETPAMKKLLKKLIEQWSRPIFAKSGNMRDLEHAHASRRTGGYVVRPQPLPASSTLPASGSTRAATDQDLQDMIKTGSKAGSKDGINRVRVPYSKGFQFTVRPQSKMGDVADKRMAKGGAAAKDNRGNLSKRMMEKTRLVTKNQSSANISIEGRQTK